MRIHLLAWLAAATLACSEGSTPTSTSIPIATPTPTPTPIATPTPPSTLPVSRAEVREPAGTVPLSSDGETVVDPAATFEVEVQGRISDARIVLLDERDAHVPAAGSREVGATTRFALSPAAPLVPGSRYVLRVEGIGAREMHDGDGRAYAPTSFALLTAGTPPPPEPRKKPKRRRR